MINRSEIKVGQFTFNALQSGPEDGPLVLMLHGWPEFATWWNHELDYLGEAGYRAVAFDQRGYSAGARPGEIADYAADHLVDDACGVATALGYDRFHLVSHDWGGMVAWRLASAQPERLLSLTVMATPHPQALLAAQEADAEQAHRLDYVRFFRRLDHAAEKALLADNAERLRADFGDRIASELVEDNVRRMQEPGTLTASLNWYRAMDEVNGNFVVPAGRITVPTLYIWGEEDQALGEDAATNTGDYVDAPYQFVRLKGASHWIPNERTEEIRSYLMAFLAKY